MTRDEFNAICKTLAETGTGGYLGPNGEPIECYDDLINVVDTMRVMQATRSNIVGGPRCGGFEPFGDSLDGCVAAAWAIPCRYSDAHHLYMWDGEAEVWRYVGAGRQTETTDEDDAGG